MQASAETASMTASHSLTVLRLQQRWRLCVRVAAVQRRKAFISAHSAAACPTYTALLSQRLQLAREICDIARAPQTKVQLRSTTAGSPLNGARFVFGFEVDGMLPSDASRAAGLQSGQRLQVAAWLARAAGLGGPPQGHMHGGNAAAAPGPGSLNMLMSESIKRFAWGGPATRSRVERLREDAEHEDA